MTEKSRSSEELSKPVNTKSLFFKLGSRMGATFSGQKYDSTKYTDPVILPDEIPPSVSTPNPEEAEATIPFENLDIQTDPESASELQTLKQAIELLKKVVEGQEVRIKELELILNANSSISEPTSTQSNP